MSVEKEDALKAGHWVEPFRGMQVWGAATGIKSAIVVRSAVEASDDMSFALFVALRELNTNEGFQDAQWLPKRARDKRRRSSASVSKFPRSLVPGRLLGDILVR